MTEVANQGVEIIRELSNTAGQGRRGEPFNQAADRLDSLASSMKSIPLNDAKLKRYREGFVNMYQSVGQSLRKMGSTRDANKFNQEIRDIQAVAIREKTLVSETNSYCGKSIPAK